MAGRDGGVRAFAAAVFRGSMSGVASAPIVGIIRSPASGYWLLARDGALTVFAEPIRPFVPCGAREGAAPVFVGVTYDTQSNGLWRATSDGSVFPCDIDDLGSLAGVRLAAPVVGITSAFTHA